MLPPADDAGVGDRHGGYERDAGSGRVDWRIHKPLRLDASLHGALSALIEVGYHAATVREIAAQAGLSVPGIYHHYPTKQDLLIALLRLTMDDLLARCGAARAEGTTPAERFACLVECLALFTFIGGN